MSKKKREPEPSSEEKFAAAVEELKNSDHGPDALYKYSIACWNAYHGWALGFGLMNEIIKKVHSK